MHPDPSQSLSNGVTGPSAILFPYPPPSLGCECHPRARQREYLTQPRGPGRGLLDWEQFHQFAARIRVLGETEHPKTLYIYDPYQQLHCGRCHEVVVAPGTLFVEIFIVRLLTYYTSILVTITRAWLWLCDWEMTTRSAERMSPSLSLYSVDSQAAKTHWQRSKFAIFLQNKNTTKSRMRRYRVVQQTDLSLVHLPSP